jgi:hypothetical protein
MPPEAFDGEFSFGTDLWSLGVILEQMKCNELEDLISNLKVKKSAERLGAFRIDDLLSHPYFDGQDF